ncbi:MAG: RHS repeat-associated core domain-containing protein [Fimbriimonadaceae bacterium]|nr:RHS repeat-associated core domain-containing protein [Fimbriimonadaceae bacterium]
MVATLTKNAAGTSWNVGNLRSYDVWGAVRSGAATGGPSGRYVANLGHVQDDESGLIYMRARYYEPGTGRFISEDPARDGGNWCGYALGNPVSKADFDGRVSEDLEDLKARMAVAGCSFLGGVYAAIYTFFEGPTPSGLFFAAVSMVLFMVAQDASIENSIVTNWNFYLKYAVRFATGGAIASMLTASKASQGTLAAAAGLGLFLQGMMCFAELLSMRMDMDQLGREG